MKKTIYTSILVFITMVGCAQNPYLDYKHAIKAGNLTSYEFTSKSIRPSFSQANRAISETRNLTILNPIVGIQILTKTKNSHEFELQNFRINETKTETFNFIDSLGISILGGVKTTNSKIAAQYKYVFNFLKQKEKRVIPSIGFGITPNLNFSKNTPLMSSSFPVNETQYGFIVTTEPRLTIYNAKKCFFEFALPLSLYKLNIVRDKLLNPAIPQNQQITTTLDSQIIPQNYYFKFSVGIKI